MQSNAMNPMLNRCGHNITQTGAKAARQGVMLTTKWHGNAEILTMVTSKNVEPLGLSNLRNPYHWKLGAPKKVHSPDLLLVDGNPIDDITLVVNSDKKFDSQHKRPQNL